MQKKRIYNIILIFIVFIIAYNISLKVVDYLIEKEKDKVLAFKNGETLVCYKTLIVSENSWKISNDKLMNNETAGYINLKNCEIK